jgi:hypothetical protein
MKRVVTIVFVLGWLASNAEAQARSSAPAQGQLSPAQARTEAEVQAILQDAIRMVARAQQVSADERQNILRELERLFARLQDQQQMRAASLQPQQTENALALVELIARIRESAPAGTPVPGQRGPARGNAAADGENGPRRLVIRPNILGGGLNVQVGGSAWWTDPALVAQLGLTEDQKTRIERAFTNHRLNLEAGRTNLEKEEARLDQLLKSEPLDRNTVLGQIFRVTNARGELERTNAAMTLEMREQMTLTQWNQLQELSPRARVMVDLPVSIAPVTPGARQ